MNKLAAKKCIPCKGEVPALKGKALRELHKELGNGWKVVRGHHLEKEFTFKNFRDALGFANKVGALAEAQNHHPDIYLSWGKARITIWTHKVDGLTESDFVLGARIECLRRPANPR